MKKIRKMLNVLVIVVLVLSVTSVYAAEKEGLYQGVPYVARVNCYSNYGSGYFAINAPETVKVRVTFLYASTDGTLRASSVMSGECTRMASASTMDGTDITPYIKNANSAYIEPYVNGTLLSRLTDMY